MKRYLILFLIVSVLGVSIFAYLFYSETGTLPALTKELHFFIISVVMANLSALIVSTIDKILDKVISWKKMFFTRFAAGFLFNVIIVSLLLVVLGYSMVLYLQQKVEPFYLQWHEEIWKLGILNLIILFIYEVFYGWFYSYRYFASTQVDQLRSERHQMELQFESLKSQISPHYLFNCLNTISSLLYKDNKVAEEFIRRMADTFRYVIGNQKRKLVTLEEELAFVKSYYYLMQVRYQDHLKLDINIPSRLLDSRVPPLAIQMLIENAVKHNEISKSHPLFIYIAAQDNTLINVSSTKTIASNAQSLNIGLANIRNRYKFFTSEKIIVKDIDKFVVQLPVIKAVDKIINTNELHPNLT
ncbi:MAG: histidine kinase [Cyclobacteriaceae bacterium]